MDGNRRWAKAHGLVPSLGHRAGYDAVRKIITALSRTGIPHAAFYAFSSENWKRSESEVSYLMELMGTAIAEFLDSIDRENEKINLRVIGDRTHLPVKLQSAILRAESFNRDDPKLTVWFAISYGGRAEIVDAVNRVIERGEKMTEDSFETFLWSKDMPDPDLIIRTGGEKRLSNFLLWKSSYSELFFTDTPWPDFGETEFQSILDEYEQRERRRGA